VSALGPAHPCELQPAAPRPLSLLARAGLLASVVLLHLAVYYSVNELNAGRTASEFWSPHTVVDDWVPYLGWTSVVYYLGDIYVVLWGAIVVWRLRQDVFLSALAAFAAIILAGAAMQALWPVEAPFPTRLAALQAFIHGELAIRPYATFPSMHVALVTLVAAIAFSVVSRLPRLTSTGAAIAIAISTITAKEHYVLDVLAGAALGLGGFVIWRVLHVPFGPNSPLAALETHARTQPAGDHHRREGQEPDGA
jgi:membrane-associated phospholipid phosphatase